MDDSKEIITHIDNCLLPKLSRNIDETDNHPELNDRQNKLDSNFPPVLEILARMGFSNIDSLTLDVLPSLIILFIERSCPTSWNTQKCKSYIQQMNEIFMDKSGISIERVLYSSDFCNVQSVFDNIMIDLNSKLTSNDFKKYPGLMDVYCLLMKDIKEYNIKINPIKVFPIALLFIDDYQNEHKIKGLKCCSSIINCLTEKHFKSGNYYEVIYGSLKKTVAIKDIVITKLVLQSLIDLINLVPLDVKNKKTDEVFGIILEQLHLESNLYRKTACVLFLKKIILVHKVNCVNRSLLKVVLLENIQICCNDAVADILLVDVLECLQVWITHCWCAWKLSTDHKMLSALIKLLYISRKESIATVIQDLILSLISLCTKEEQAMIHKNLEKSDIKCPEFYEKMEEIKRETLKLCG